MFGATVSTHKSTGELVPVRLWLVEVTDTVSRVAAVSAPRCVLGALREGGAREMGGEAQPGGAVVAGDGGGRGRGRNLGQRCVSDMAGQQRGRTARVAASHHVGLGTGCTTVQVVDPSRRGHRENALRHVANDGASETGETISTRGSDDEHDTPEIFFEVGFPAASVRVTVRSNGAPPGQVTATHADPTAEAAVHWVEPPSLTQKFWAPGSER